MQSVTRYASPSSQRASLSQANSLRAYSPTLIPRQRAKVACFQMQIKHAGWMWDGGGLQAQGPTRTRTWRTWDMIRTGVRPATRKLKHPSFVRELHLSWIRLLQVSSIPCALV